MKLRAKLNGNMFNAFRHFLLLVYLISWSYAEPASQFQYLDEPMAVIYGKHSVEHTSGQDEILLPNRESHTIISNHNHHIDKRAAHKGFKPRNCGRYVAQCALLPHFTIFCLLDCIISSAPFMAPLLYAIPQSAAFMCNYIGLKFKDLPALAYDNRNRIRQVNSFLKAAHVEDADIADFAKSAINALPLVLIRKAKGLDFEHARPVLRALDLEPEHPPASEWIAKRKKAIKASGGHGQMFGRPLGSGIGPSWTDNSKFVNKKCPNIDIIGPASMLVNAIRRKPCNSDMLMPGYFLMSKAPKVAWTQAIKPIIRAFNGPLYLLTGVKCCLLPYADNKKRRKCTHDYPLLEKPHGRPPKEGPETVCGSIPPIFGGPPTKTNNTVVPGEGEAVETTLDPCKHHGDDNDDVYGLNTYDCSSETTVAYDTYDISWEKVTTTTPEPVDEAVDYD